MKAVTALVLLLPSSFLPIPAAAQCGRAGLIDAPIVFGAHERRIAEAGVPGLLETVTVLSAPGHGQLRISHDGYHFTPALSFWSVGTDSFTVAIGSLAGTTMKTIRLLAPIVREVEAPVEEAEAAPIPGAAWQLMGNPAEVQFGPEAALSGLKGLLILGGPSADVYLAATPPPAPEPPSNIEGTGSSGSGGQGGWRPPGGGGGGGLALVTSCIPTSLVPCGLPPSESIVAALASSAGPVVSARMRTSDLGVELRLEVATVPPTPWVRVSQTPHQLVLLGWNDAWNHPQGAALYVDGKPIASLQLAATGLPSFSRLEARFGTLDAVGSVPAHGWDQLRAFSFRGPRPRAICLREDRFPALTMSNQWELLNPPNLEIPAFSVSGSGGSSSHYLEVAPAGPGTPPGGAIRAVDLAAPVRRLGVRFRFSTDALDLPLGDSIVLLDAAHSAIGPRAFRIVLARGAAGNLRLFLMARHTDAGQAVATTSVAVPAGSWHRLELDWQRSESTVAGTGYLRLWINGAEAAELLGLHNSGLILTDVRLGGVAQFGLPPGVMRFDDVEMWMEP